jgi:hypothetical protein
MADSTRPIIKSRSRRSLASACKKAKVPLRLESIAELGETFLALLIAGTDHQHVGQACWFEAILTTAPKPAKEEPRCPHE